MKDIIFIKSWQQEVILQMVKCGKCKYFEYRFTLDDGARITYCRYHQKQYINGLSEEDFCSKGERKVTLPFDQGICDRRNLAANIADCSCAYDCEMECPYKKD